MAQKKQTPQKSRPKAERNTQQSSGNIVKIFDELKKINPNPKTELEYINTFTLLVAVVLSAQATDKGVNKATQALFKVASTPQAMINLGQAAIENNIKTIGLYKNKAKNVYALSKMLLERHNGIVPQTEQELTALPGVGRKTANVILNEAFGQPTIAVDTHIFRVAHRLGFSQGKTPDAVEKDLQAIIPEPYKKSAHHWLILHGRYTCTARKPRCEACSIRDLCPYQNPNGEGIAEHAKSETNAP